MVVISQRENLRLRPLLRICWLLCNRDDWGGGLLISDCGDGDDGDGDDGKCDYDGNGDDTTSSASFAAFLAPDRWISVPSQNLLSRWNKLPA